MSIKYLWTLFPITGMWGSFWIWEITKVPYAVWWGFPFYMTCVLVVLAQFFFVVNKILED